MDWVLPMNIEQHNNCSFEKTISEKYIKVEAGANFDLEYL